MSEKRPDPAGTDTSAKAEATEAAAGTPGQSATNQTEPASEQAQAGGADPQSAPAGAPETAAPESKAAAAKQTAAPGGKTAAAKQTAADAGVPEQPAASGGTAEAETRAEATVVGEPAAPEESATGAEPAGTAPAAGGLGAELAALRGDLDERTRDLQRVTAEYANYRKRVDRDRKLVSEQAVANVLSALLPVLDDVDRAREHGDLTGPFGSVAEQLQTALSKFGLAAFGSKGDPFDPNLHEAVAHLPSADVTEPTCIDVMRQGYLLGEKLLRPAMVAVAAPE